MYIEELPYDACFEYEGEKYIKTGSIFGTGQLGPRQIPKDAYLKPIDDEALKKLDKKTVPISERLKWMNSYLAEGNGRGHLNSDATIFNGSVGYFFVSTIEISGVKKECIRYSSISDEMMISTILELEEMVKNGESTVMLAGAREVECWPQSTTNGKNHLAERVDEVADYLDVGPKRGRLPSRATIYDGRVGYFFIDSIEVNGQIQDSILFSDLQEPEVITAFPLIPKFWEQSQVHKRNP